MAMTAVQLPLSFAQVLLFLRGAKQPDTQDSCHFSVSVRNTRSKNNYRGGKGWCQPTFPGQRPSWRGIRARSPFRRGTEAETMLKANYLLRSQPPFFYSNGPRAYGCCHPQWAGPSHTIIYQDPPPPHTHTVPYHCAGANGWLRDFVCFWVCTTEHRTQGLAHTQQVLFPRALLWLPVFQTHMLLLWGRGWNKWQCDNEEMGGLSWGNSSVTTGGGSCAFLAHYQHL